MKTKQMNTVFNLKNSNGKIYKEKIKGQLKNRKLNGYGIKNY